MSKILLPPDDLSKATAGITLQPFDIKKEDPQLFALLQDHAEARKKLQSPQASGSWFRSGIGPAPVLGGTWYRGTILTPLSTPPSTGIVDNINYSYDNSYFGGWTSEISVRMVITAGSSAWLADITSANSGTVGTSGAGIPADCQVQFQMKVGMIPGTLYDPPYILSNEVTVLFNY